MRELLREIRWREHSFGLIRLGVAISLLVTSLLYYLDSREAFKNETVNQAAQLYAQDEAEHYQDVLKDNIAEYAEYVDYGYIGTPQRLQWVESFRQVVSRLNLQGVEFTLEKGRPAEQYINAYWDPEVEVRVTDMKVTMRLSHEGNLHQLLTELEKEARGLFSVDRCDLIWLDSSAIESQTTRLRGECYLRWYTLADVTEKWRETPRL